ncbi:hypothetical protein F66182_8250 [Fusarium sp. NRRL 66182]|nr:hypothetical protein F66182_8250 [Fusarium sp. NRRL 66182]
MSPFQEDPTPAQSRAEQIRTVRCQNRPDVEAEAPPKLILADYASVIQSDDPNQVAQGSGQQPPVDDDRRPIHTQPAHSSDEFQYKLRNGIWIPQSVSLKLAALQQ